MNIITSTKNEKIQKIKSLNTSKGRAEQSKFLCEGEHMVEEAINSGKNISSIVVREDSFERYKNLINKAEAEIIIVSTNVFNSICDTKTPQGISAVVDMFNGDMSFSNFVLAMNGVQDPGNVGTIIRTADAAGFTDVLIDAQSADIFNPKTVRASMGSIFNINCHKTDNMLETLNGLKQKKYAVIGSTLNGDNFYNRQKNLNKIVLIIGNEGSGINEDVLNACTHNYKLPMQGKAESLNAAIAAAIMMYDIINNK
ncbi:MAG: RNA methyltransferase [Christensenellaceae bacterium]|nr:RNA methyltransferase [Christensenellaceae bacterium]